MIKLSNTWQNKYNKLLEKNSIFFGIDIKKKYSEKLKNNDIINYHLKYINKNKFKSAKFLYTECIIGETMIESSNQISKIPYIIKIFNEYLPLEKEHPDMYYEESSIKYYGNGLFIKLSGYKRYKNLTSLENHMYSINKNLISDVRVDMVYFDMDNYLPIIASYYECDLFRLKYFSVPASPIDTKKIYNIFHSYDNMINY